MRLLIVEDEAIIARDLATTVEAFGHQVVGIADSGEEALAVAAKVCPDLVLMDIQLSGALDGIATAQQLQARLQLPVVYLSAHADEATLRRAAATAPAGYVLKPLHWSTLAVTGMALVFHDISTRRAAEAAQREAEAALRQSHAQLAASLAELERRATELTVLSELGGALMRCTDLDAGYVLVTRAAQQLFPEVAGTLFVQRPEVPALEAVLAWGVATHPYPPLHPAHCRALRQGRIVLGEEPCGGCRCEVIPSTLSRAALCVPLVVEGDTLGVLHVHLPVGERAAPLQAARRQLALAFAEQAALGLANVRLRMVLREQAIRDPLTGLFNRRYLEETLVRELHRASRDCYPVGVVILDVDHFKHINDTYGHEAGDAVLRAIGQALSAGVRAGDVVCRYGGEEFVLMLPTASLEVVVARAEALGQSIRELGVTHHGILLPRVTVSLGGTVVDHAEASMAEALARADAALYAAKRAGRDRVVTLAPGSVAHGLTGAR